MQEMRKKRTRIYKRKFLFFTGVEGIEPPLKVLETSVIPLDQTPLCLTHQIFIPQGGALVNCYLNFFTIL